MQVLYAQNTKPLYQLPEKTAAAAEVTADQDIFLVGSDNGLFRVTSSNNVIPLWTQARVDQITRVTVPASNGQPQDAWYIRTQKGLFYTTDFKNFTEKDNGLPFLTIKKYDGKTPRLEKQIQELKDFCVNGNCYQGQRLLFFGRRK